MVKKAEELSIKYIFFAGDCFDSRTFQRQSLLKTFDEMLDYVDKSSCEMYAIPGNHDKTLYSSKYSFLNPFKFHPSFHYIDDLNTINFKDIGKTITFLPFFEEEMLLDKIKISEKSDILISHFEMEGSTNLGRTITKSKIKIDSLNKWGKVFLGHYHNYHKISNNIFHLPSFLQNNFGEDLNKGFTIIYEDDSHEIIQSNSKKYIKVEINIDEMKQNELEDLKKIYANSLDSIMFKISGSEAKIKSLDKSQFQELGITINCNYDFENNFDEMDIPKLKTSYDEVGIKDAFKNYCSSKKIDETKFNKYLYDFLKLKK